MAKRSIPVSVLQSWFAEYNTLTTLTNTCMALTGAMFLSSYPIQHSIDNLPLARTLRWGSLIPGFIVKSKNKRMEILEYEFSRCQVYESENRVDRYVDQLKTDYVEPKQMEAELIEPEALPEPLEIVQVKDVLPEGTGIALLGNSGAGKTSVCMYLAGEMEAEKVIVCNPHDDGMTWPDGITVYSDYDDIFNYLEQSLADLETRKQAKRQKQPLTRLVEFLDEWPSVRVEAKRRKLDICERFIIRSGSECRKYNKLSVFCSQSGNVKALGLDRMGDFLENYSLIRLNKIALKYAKTHPDRRIIQALKSTAYCAMVNDDLSVHPTHSHYQQVKDKQPPANLKPLQLSPVQKSVNAEVIPEVSLTKPNPSPTSPNQPLAIDLTGLTENYQVSELRLSEAVKALTEGGYSDTKIIKDILGMKGVNYRKGKDLLSALKELT